MIITKRRLNKKIKIGLIIFLCVALFAAAAQAVSNLEGEPTCIVSYDGEPEVILPQSAPDPIIPIVQIEEQYPEAAHIWDTLISWGWRPETVAGIIGNMMAEVGSGTLDLSYWNANTSSGYGLIQWTNGRRAEIKNRYGEYPTIDQQLEYMKDELFGANGLRPQVTASQLALIMEGETPEDVAFAFATYYERCATQYRAMRKDYARVAYEYFMR